LKLDLFSIVWNLASLIVTVVLHSVGTVLIVSQRSRMFRFKPRQHNVIWGQFVVTLIVIELLILHLVEIGFWGLCLRALGQFTSLSAALYFAGISYTSLGYSGTLLSSREGFSEVLIAMIGLLMFGWSVGILVTTVLQYEKRALGWDPTRDEVS
jgi:hypothetical protein